MASATNAFRDDAEAVVLEGCRPADTAKETLLNATLELDDGNTRRWGGDFDWDLADSEPREEDAEGDVSRIINRKIKDKDKQDSNAHGKPKLL